MTKLVLFLLVVALAFVAGTRSDYIWASLTGHKVSSDSIDLSSVELLYRELAGTYDGTLDKQALVDGAKHGLVEAVGDPYTVYFTAKEAEEFRGDLEGTFEGIGAELGKRDGVLTIMSTLDGSPAKSAGLRAGDAIVKVNDEESAKWSVEKAVREIRGDKGTTVKLTIARSDAVQEVSVVRATITDPSVKWEVTTDNIGIIRISRFGQTDTAQLARKAAQEFKDRGVRGIILDLRGNGGGYVTAAQDIASLWLKDKVVVTQRSKNNVTDTLRTRGEAPLEGIKTIVLVNEGSASASEILAGALQDHKAATLVGTHTFGKSVVQDTPTLSDGGTLKVTIASWYTPDGVNLGKDGLKPTVQLEMSDEDYTAGRDPQKDKALELLK